MEHAQQALAEARDKLVRQRHRAALLGVMVLGLAAAAVVATQFGATGRIVATVSAALALVSAAAGLLGRAQNAAEQVGDLADAGRSGIATLGRLFGRPEELAVQAKAAEQRCVEKQHDAANAEVTRLATAKKRVTELAREQPLGALLHRLATNSEYREQLSLVTRTRDHFKAVDNEISATRAKARNEAQPSIPSAPADGTPADTANPGDTVTGEGAEAAGYFLPEFGHADVALGPVVVRGHPEVAGEPEVVVLAVDQAPSGRRAGAARRGSAAVQELGASGIRRRRSPRANRVPGRLTRARICRGTSGLLMQCVQVLSSRAARTRSRSARNPGSCSRAAVCRISMSTDQ